MPGRNECTVILSERSESKNLLAQQKTASHGKNGNPGGGKFSKTKYPCAHPPFSGRICARNNRK